MRMKLTAGEALGLVEQEDCPEAAAFEDITVGMQFEQIIELQDLVKIYDEEYIRLKAVINGLMNGGNGTSEQSSRQPNTGTRGAAERIAVDLNHCVSHEATQGWFVAEDINEALHAWKNNSVLSEKGRRTLDASIHRCCMIIFITCVLQHICFLLIRGSFFFLFILFFFCSGYV
jgi:hypothetical protein